MYTNVVKTTWSSMGGAYEDDEAGWMREMCGENVCDDIESWTTLVAWQCFPVRFFELPKCAVSRCQSFFEHVHSQDVFGPSAADMIDTQQHHKRSVWERENMADLEFREGQFSEKENSVKNNYRQEDVVPTCLTAAMLVNSSKTSRRRISCPVNEVFRFGRGRN